MRVREKRHWGAHHSGHTSASGIYLSAPHPWLSLSRATIFSLSGIRSKPYFLSVLHIVGQQGQATASYHHHRSTTAWWQISSPVRFLCPAVLSANPPRCPSPRTAYCLPSPPQLLHSYGVNLFSCARFFPSGCLPYFGWYFGLHFSLGPPDHHVVSQEAI